MKVTINKFMELQNVSFTTPVKIEAGHDVGKSTIFRAVLFAITGKDVNGKEFDGCIYPKISDRVEDLQVEVTIEQSGVIFTKTANGAEKRQKGSEETTLQRSVTATYMLNYMTVGKAEYDEKVSEIFKQFQLFCNPDFFRNLDKKEKRSIFASLVEIDKNSYFFGIADKATTNGKLIEQNKAISAKQANLIEMKSVQQPQPIELVDYKSQIDALQKQRNEMQPTLTEAQASENLHTDFEIQLLKKSVFIPEKLLPSWAEPEIPNYTDIEYLQKELDNTKISEPNLMMLDVAIDNFKKKIDVIKSLTLQIENYEDNVKNSKCTVCQVCFTPCEFKRVELKPLSELQDEFSRLMPLEFAEKSLQNAESQKIDFIRKFEDDKAEKIDTLQKQILDSENKNAEIKADFVKRMQIVEKENAEIYLKNEEMKNSNACNAANFETERAEKIQVLKSKLHERAAFNPFEIDDKISSLQNEDRSQQLAIDSYNEQNGTFNYAQKRITEISEELQEMKKVLINCERDLIAFEAAEKQYYTDFENKINSEMPENVKVFLFKKNLSNDGYSEVFDIEFNGSIYAGNGKTIAFYIFLCNWFQQKFGVDLPIFIDEAIILQEKLYSEVKNTVVLMRNDEQNTLKITEL